MQGIENKKKQFMGGALFSWINKIIKSLIQLINSFIDLVNEMHFCIIWNEKLKKHFWLYKREETENLG